jgi:hypothetical protein
MAQNQRGAVPHSHMKDARVDATTSAAGCSDKAPPVDLRIPLKGGLAPGKLQHQCLSTCTVCASGGDSQWAAAAVANHMRSFSSSTCCCSVHGWQVQLWQCNSGSDAFSSVQQGCSTCLSGAPCAGHLC